VEDAEAEAEAEEDWAARPEGGRVLAEVEALLLEHLEAASAEEEKGLVEEEKGLVEEEWALEPPAEGSVGMGGTLELGPLPRQEHMAAEQAGAEQTSRRCRHRPTRWLGDCTTCCWHLRSMFQC
jgi:hypothetical protein